MIRAALIAAGLLIASVTADLAPSAAAEPAPPSTGAQATIVTRAGNHYAFKVELARTEMERVRGLQGRRTLADNAGMLFDFESPRPVAMWMKDTPLALDMIFIAGDGRIVNIARDTTPGSLKVIESDGPVKGVLEVKAGTTARLGVRPGDRVVHEIFR